MVLSTSSARTVYHVSGCTVMSEPEYCSKKVLEPSTKLDSRMQPGPSSSTL